MTAPILATIPFNRAILTGRELENIQQAVETMHLSGDGPFTRRCHALLEQALGAPKVLLTTSCTHALEMSALLLDIRPGDEVILPSFTFVSTANAFVLRGAKPVFADIRPDTLNLDETRLEALITARTRAVVVVHYAGVACEMDAILAIARRHGVAVVEDAAHGLFGCYKGRALGTFGELATLSFHETKNVTCGEGGALIVNNESYIQRAEVIREKGTNRSSFFRGQVDKYTWVDVGSSYLPSEILAAFLYAQLEAGNRIQARRRVLWTRYRQELAAWASDRGVGLPVVPDHCEQPFHLFYLILPSLEQRQSLIAHLASAQVTAIFHYQPLHLSEMGRRWGGAPGDCPVTERVSDGLLRLPLSMGLTDAEQERVIAAVLTAP
ncbi:MAG: dTDP-4-amino-4,6-dideoxygalactose transaminase [Acidobacteria bacterium]|nr:dTDP-4-amino-4,6-dideoxygalactose transaminase [Acidobacteriota bacterium]